MSFNHQTRNANWVYEILNRETIADNLEEVARFGDDYQRGHLAAAANHRWCREAFDDTNMNDNIVPQRQNLNTGPWKTLETECRRTAAAPNICNVHVYSGPLYLRQMVHQGPQGKLVPSHFFKVIIEENENRTVNQPKCYVFPNGNLQGESLGDVHHHETTIEYIQNVSRMTFIQFRPNQEPMEITALLRGENRNAVICDANIQVTISN
ncbi:Endonuclease G, mitochondrial [Labeo rohita]|uniref:Endonuclease G, mitochondrial n=2 Tax=Labeo rohita TaxID=84645 RepID=A0ABQ8L5H2_LABRO|nr:Endonuclease G, mitochondrial [Labeo rohita]